MDRPLKWYIINVMLPLALIMTFVTMGAHADTLSPGPAMPPVLIQQNTTYQEGSGGIASDVCPNAILSVAVIPMGTATISTVVVDVSQVNVTGSLSMVQTGTIVIGNSTALLYSANVFVDKTLRPGGAKSLPVTATDNTGQSGTTSLTIIAFTKMGVGVVGYDSSKPVPAHPANASMFYDHNTVKIIVTSLDTTHYTNVTASFASVDGSTAVEYNNNGVLLPDGNYSYEITHTLGVIPGMENVNQTWINVTFNTSTPSGNQVINIPQIGALTICGNINPKYEPDSGLGGDTTDWRTIQDYSAAYLVFEAVNSSTGSPIAKLQFNEPIDLTNYETAMALKQLGQYLMMSGKSMDLNATADALIGFNKASTLTIYNLTAFTIDPGILQNNILVPSSGSGSVVTNKVWYNSTKTLTFSVAHWTSYSWDGEPPSLSSLAVDYPSGQTSVKSGQSVTLHGIVTDSYSGVLNVTADATSIGAGKVIFSNTAGNVWSNTTVVTAQNGNYPLTVTAYDKAANKNTGIITVSVDNNIISRNATVGVWRAGTFYFKDATSIAYGISTDTPVVGDWNGDGKSEVGVFRGGVFYRNGADAIPYGISTDTPVVGDWNGDGKSEVGVFRGGVFYRYGADAIVYGLSTDTPVIGTWA